ncbi:MAG: hypothetical protein ACRC40_02030 [Fusobacteriaceae bacterium]
MKTILFLMIFSMTFSKNLTDSYKSWKDESIKVSKDDLYREFPTEKDFRMHEKILKLKYDEAQYKNYLDKNNLENKVLEAEIYHLYNKKYYENNYYINNNYYRKKRGY